MQKKQNISAVLLIGILSFLLLPALQKQFQFFKEKPLDGDVSLADDIEFTAQNWFDGVYSESKEKYLNDNIGFHHFLIRLNNQYHFSLFNKAFAKGVIAGKDGFLFEKKYLEAHAGLDYVGEEEIKTRFEKLKFIQDTLAKKGIYFAVLFAPGKATYYPEYIPAPYNVSTTKTNYLEYIKIAKQTGVNFYDFNELFVQLKPTANYPLYPKTGMHWSVYGMHLAFDSLTRYMERVSNFQLTRFDYSNVRLSDSLIAPDGDIAEGMNLFYKPPHFTMAYPQISYKDNSSQKPNVLAVSDSYWMGMYFLDLPKNVFNQHEFWYYNKQLYNYDLNGKIGAPADFDLKQSIEKNNFVFIMSTEATLDNIGWGFIDEVYTAYKGDEQTYITFSRNRKRNSEITQIKLNIKHAPEWLNAVKNQARELHISLDSALQLNAEYVYWEQNKERDSEIAQIKRNIQNTPEWLNAVKNQAKELNISLDSALQLNAEYVYSEQNKK